MEGGGERKGGREGMREVIVQIVIAQTTVSVVVFIRRENQEMNILQNGIYQY